jgi:outer membrane autotransporter protein
MQLNITLLPLALKMSYRSISLAILSLTASFFVPIGAIVSEEAYYRSDDFLEGELIISPGDQGFLKRNASLGNAIISNYSYLELSHHSSAEESKVTNRGVMLFLGSSSGGNSEIQNDEILQFDDSSTMAGAKITNDYKMALKGNANGGHARVINDNEFTISGNSTADQAHIRNNNIIHVNENASLGDAEIYNCGDCFAYDCATMGNSRIVNDQQLKIFQHASAANSHITNNYALHISGHGNAGSATIINNHIFYLHEHANAEHATVLNSGDSIIDISRMRTSGIAIGSLTGEGRVFLGSKNLTLGGLGRDDTLFSVIHDGAYESNNILIADHNLNHHSDYSEGGITKIGNGTLTFAVQSQYTGKTQITKGVLRAGIKDAFSPYSSFHVYDRAILDLGGKNQFLKELTNEGCVNFSSHGPDTILTVNQLHLGAGSFCMKADLTNATGDHLVICGPSTGSYLVQVENWFGIPEDARGAFELISTSDGMASFYLDEPLDVGPYAYTLERGNGSEKTPLSTNWYLTNTRLNSLTAAAVNTVRAIPLTWFEEMSTLIGRMGELRLQKQCLNPTGEIWARSYGQKTNVYKHHEAPKFRSTQYGIEIGADKIWMPNEENAIYTGIFGGYSRAEVILHGKHCSGVNKNSFGGLYITWMNTPGWYLDAVVKSGYFINSFKAVHSQAPKNHGRFNTWGTGFTLEGGRRFGFDHGFFLEPQVQVSYLHLCGKSFNAHYFRAEVSDSDVLQLRGGLLAAYKMESCTYGQLEFYLRASIVQQSSQGGHWSGGGLRCRTLLDGTRVDFDGGIAAQLNDEVQVHLNYEVSIADRYNKPWGFNVDARYQF